MNRTVGDDFPQAMEIHEGFNDFFRGLMAIAGARRPTRATGEALRRYVLGFLQTCDTARFRKLPGESYTRICLGRDEATGWEAILMCWERGSATAIHGHPDFAAYNFASGRFRVELFDLDAAGRPQPSGAIEAAGGEGYFAVGRPGTLDNHIHRITCLSGAGHSLHVYRGDARKGIAYEA